MAYAMRYPFKGIAEKAKRPAARVARFSTCISAFFTRYIMQTIRKMQRAKTAQKQRVTRKQRLCVTVYYTAIKTRYNSTTAQNKAM